MKNIHFNSPRRRLFTFISGMTVIVLFVYGILNLFFLNFIVGILELVLSLSLFVTLFFIKKKQVYKISTAIYVACTTTICFYLFQSGGFHNTGIFWFFIFPVTYFLFLGKFWGLVSYSILFSGAAVMALLSQLSDMILPYPMETLLFFFSISILEATILYIYQKILEHHLEHIFLLEGLMPICSNCKKIRDEEGTWEPMDFYLHKHTNIEFTHGLCPDCATKLYPEYTKKTNKSES